MWSSRKPLPAGRRPRWAAGPRHTPGGGGSRPRAPEAVSGRAFDALGADGPERLKLLHQVDNPASCRVAHKSGYGLDSFLPAAPPLLPREGHPHIRCSGDGAPYRCRP